MSKEQYQESMNGLYNRFVNARKNHCNLVAMARIRDMAKLKAQFSGRKYEDILTELFSEYNVR